MSNMRTFRLSQTNCYLLETAAGLCLIDCGNSRDQNKLVAALNHAGFDLSQIQFLVLTHHHGDHCGLVNFLTAANPKMRVVMSRRCSEILMTGTSFKPANEVYANACLNKLIRSYLFLSRALSDSFPPYSRRAEDILIENDCELALTGMGPNPKIIVTPGHTQDGLSVVFGNSAFVGDAARNILNFTGAKYLPILYSDLAACYSSWDKLNKAGVDMIYPAHGKPFQAKKLKIPPKNLY